MFFLLPVMFAASGGIKINRCWRKRGSLRPLVARHRSVADIGKHTLVRIDHAQLVAGHVLHFFLSAALGDVRGKGVIFLLLGLYLRGQSVFFCLCGLHLALQCVELPADSAQQGQHQDFGHET